MMKYKKSTRWVLALFTGLFFANYVYADRITVDGIRYELYPWKGTATVIGSDGCRGDVVIPDYVSGYTVDRIEDFASYNEYITSIVIGNNVTYIGHSAFWHCTNLKSVTIGKNVIEIDGWYHQINGAFKKGTFEGCKRIEKVVCLNEHIIAIDSWCFDDDVYYNATLIVPKGLKEKYKQVSPWNRFLTIEEVDFYSKHNLTFLVDGEIYEQYQLGYEEETTEPKRDPWIIGYSFSGWSEIPQLMPDTDVNVNAIFTPKEEITIWGQSEGHATFYHGGASYQLPKGIIAQVVTSVEGGKIEYKTIADGDQTMNVVPKGVPVMLVNKDKKSGGINLTLSQSSVTYNGPNLLRGVEGKVNSDVTIATPRHGEYVYKLCYQVIGNVMHQTFGWYWGAENGGTFENHIRHRDYNRAWLAVPIQKATRGFVLGVK